MEWLRAILQNRVLWVSVGAWAAAQVVKVIIDAYLNGKLDLTRLVGDGGMPSCHSAAVSALAVSCGLSFGWDSGLFAVSAMFAVVVMHDARGVRLETGKQAHAINELWELLQPASPEEQRKKLKELVGHTPSQVYTGALLGVLFALILG